MKEGLFLVKNYWGRQGLKVLLLDSWAGTAAPIWNNDTYVWDATGTIKWRCVSTLTQ